MDLTKRIPIYTNTGWSTYLGRQHRLPQQYAPPLTPLPRHPSLSHSRSQPDMSSAPATAQSEFARDVYAAGSSDDRIILPASPKNTCHNQYAPPPGPLPGSSGNASTGARKARKDMQTMEADEDSDARASAVVEQ